MIQVKLFGLLRLDTGLKELKANAKTVKDLYPLILQEAKKLNPSTTVSAKDIDGCIVVVNNVQKNKNAKLKDGDVVMLMSPVCGG
ncbi:MAG: MoaD/ThiS family protein [Lachnospiraceae bacterium]|nr:MoaD/ThiS family protein [Lachnospiraceae bacterium]